LDALEVELLKAEDHGLVRDLLVELHLSEQPHYPDHPQLSRRDLESGLTRVPSGFTGENVVFAVRDQAGGLAGFCWCVIFDPGSGLEGEVAEVYVAGEQRGRGVGEALINRAVELFKEKGVTLGYVWTRSENEAAVNLYQKAGFNPSSQLVLVWYPVD
jgi:ribosomal protein S18 acetylase RimI-like enzyme